MALDLWDLEVHVQHIMGILRFTAHHYPWIVRFEAHHYPWVEVPFVLRPHTTERFLLLYGKVILQTGS